MTSGAGRACEKFFPTAAPFSGKTTRLSEAPVDIVIEGRMIADIRPHGAADADGETIDMGRRLIAPGLINGHHHSHEGYYKGRKDNLPLELWMNYVRPLKPIDLTPRDVYLRTMIGAIEAVKSGTTTICDDLNASPRLGPEHVEAAFQAYEDIGIRANVGHHAVRQAFFSRAAVRGRRVFPRASGRTGRRAGLLAR